MMASSVIIQLHIGAAGEESHVATLSGAARSAMATSDDNKEARRPQSRGRPVTLLDSIIVAASTKPVAHLHSSNGNVTGVRAVFSPTRPFFINKLCGRPPQYAPAPCKLTFDLLISKVVSESCTWATSVPILVFLGLSVLHLGPMYATDRETSDRRQTSDAHHRLIIMPPLWGRGIKTSK